MENAKIEKFKYDILSNFQTLFQHKPDEFHDFFLLHPVRYINKYTMMSVSNYYCLLNGEVYHNRTLIYLNTYVGCLKA